MAESFAEEAVPVSWAAHAAKSPGTTAALRLNIGKDGRVVVPSALRKQMGISGEAVLIARVVDGVLRLETPAVSLEHIRAVARKYKKPDESVVDEFIAERRAEAAREDLE